MADHQRILKNETKSWINFARKVRAGSTAEGLAPLVRLVSRVLRRLVLLVNNGGAQGYSIVWRMVLGAPTVKGLSYMNLWLFGLCFVALLVFVSILLKDS
jgi:hypothetical protein